MSDFVVYGWPLTMLGIVLLLSCYLWWESRRVDRAIANSAAEAEAARVRGDTAAPPR